MRRLLTYSILLLVALSCSRKEDDFSNQEGMIVLPVQTKATFSPSSQVTPSTVLVSNADDYAVIGSFGLTSPLYNLDVDDIFQWEGRKYNTLVHYPGDDSPVYVFSYAPSDILSTSDNWTSLDLDYPGGDYDNSIWDKVLVAGPVSGKASVPISDALSYGHAVSRFNFSAYKDESMTKYGVKDVVITAEYPITPYSLSWEDGIWRPSGLSGNVLDIEVKDDNLSLTILGIGTENAIDEGPFYLIPQAGNTIGPFTITATYFIETPVYTETEHIKSNIYFEINTSGSGTIRAGYDYLVKIRFNQDSFMIYGICMDDWEDGGNIIIPIINETLQW